MLIEKKTANTAWYLKGIFKTTRPFYTLMYSCPRQMEYSFTVIWLWLVPC